MTTSKILHHSKMIFILKSVDLSFARNVSLLIRIFEAACREKMPKDHQMCLEYKTVRILTT